MAVADQLGRVLGPHVEVHAFDGSHWGSPDAPLGLEVVSPEAVTHLLRRPGGLGMARGYVSGALRLVRGDVYTAVKVLDRARIGSLTPREWAGVAGGLGAHLVHRAEPPPEELPAPWRRTAGRRMRHSLGRDAAAIAHHYDVSNRFYEMVLGESMVYTCAVFPTADATLDQAQEAKLELVCRKLDLSAGDRLLDVGCGWGSMAMHAASRHRVRVLGVTLSRAQAEYGRKRVADAGLSDLVEIRHSDYRNVTEGGFDAVSSIGLTEHIGARGFGAYVAFLHDRLRPGGRLLNHSIMRPTTTEPVRVRGFIDRYVFPDGELMGLGAVITGIQDHGFEVRHTENLREHYAQTLTGWCDNLDRNWDAAVAEAGEARARVWALYMAGSRLGFETGRLQLHQVLAVRPDPAGNAHFPLRSHFEQAPLVVSAS